MLVLTRKLSETIVIGGNISITVVGLRGNQVRLGITAPQSLGIYREELYERTAGGENELVSPEAELAHASNGSVGAS
jgi:carbon storage regulator